MKANPPRRRTRSTDHHRGPATEVDPDHPTGTTEPTDPAAFLAHVGWRKTATTDPDRGWRPDTTAAIPAECRTCTGGADRRPPAAHGSTGARLPGTPPPGTRHPWSAPMTGATSELVGNLQRQSTGRHHRPIRPKRRHWSPTSVTPVSAPAACGDRHRPQMPIPQHVGAGWWWTRRRRRVHRPGWALAANLASTRVPVSAVRAGIPDR